MSDDSLVPYITDQDDEDYLEESPEGKLITALHRKRERNRRLIQDRKRKALNETGELRCEGCGMTYEQHYGKHGPGFIEVHHTKPVHTMKEGEKTKLEDLALVCANCHRMIHRTGNWLTIERLRAILMN